MKRLLFFTCLFLFLFSNSLRAQNLTQTIRGTVVDKSLKTPLPGATIILPGSDPIKGSTSDVDGKFRIENVPVGRHTLRVSFLGYNEITIPNLLITSGKETVLTLEMEEKVIQGKMVEVTATTGNMEAGNEQVVSSVTTLKAEQINRFAGSRADPSRMASNYAGVVSGGDQRNDIIVRGNTPSGILWRLEGIDIPSPNHFSFTGNSGGAVSILNNNVLSNSDFITGAFPAEYGNKLSAVFDVKMRNGNNEKREHTIMAGLAGLELMTEGPVSKNGSYLVSYRFFTFDILDKLNVNIGVNGKPEFQDVNFKINLPTKKSGTFTLWGMGGKSHILIEDSKKDTSEWYGQKVYDTDFNSDMFALGLTHSHLIGKKTIGKFSLSSSGSHYHALIERVAKDQSRELDEKYDNLDMQYLTQYNLVHKASARHLFKLGINYRILSFNNENTFFSSKDGQYVDALRESGETGLLQSYGHWQFSITERLTWHSGLFYQKLMLNNSQSLEPRAAISFEPNDKQRIHFAYGLHSQSQQLVYYTYRFFDPATGKYNQSNRNIDLTKAHHFTGGYRRFLTSVLEVKAEAYYQKLFNVPVSLKQNYGWYSMLNVGADYSIFSVDSLVNEGSGHNYGIEFTVERHFEKSWYFLSTLSLFRSRYKGYDQVERPTAFDVGYVSNLLAGKEFKLDEHNKKVLSIDFKITYTGGKPFIPINVDLSKLAGGVVYDLDRVYEPRVRDYFRTDFKAGLNINRKKATHNFYIAADNLFNTQNELTRYWDSGSQTIQTEYQLGLFPYAGYRVNF